MPARIHEILMPTLHTAALCLCLAISLPAAAFTGGWPDAGAAAFTWSGSTLAGQMLAQADQDQAKPDEPQPGELVLPQGASKADDSDKKKCMTVCARWGEECTLINQGAGGLQRRCRRTCQQFSEECF